MLIRPCGDPSQLNAEVITPESDSPLLIMVRNNSALQPPRSKTIVTSDQVAHLPELERTGWIHHPLRVTPATSASSARPAPGPDRDRFAAKTEMAAAMTNMLKLQVQRAEQACKTRSVALRFEWTQLVQHQREERERLRAVQELRWNAKTRARAERLSKGFRGIWDRLTGKFAGIKRQSEREALVAFCRDREEKDNLIFSHIEERQRLHSRILEERKTLALEVQRLHRDIATQKERRTADPSRLGEQFRNAVQNRQPDPNRGPEFER